MHLILKLGCIQLSHFIYSTEKTTPSYHTLNLLDYIWNDVGGEMNSENVPLLLTGTTILNR